MEPSLLEIREQQKETWNQFSPGWKKWNAFTMKFLKPVGDVIIAALDIQEEDIVLDVACGTGEPGLTIAGLTTKGKVTGTDLANQMLEIANENAARKEIKNYETIACDVCELPFAENSFDKISCRMGFMSFPDLQLASDQMYRVLKPAGKMATSVWISPDKNSWITTIKGIIHKNIQVDTPPPGTPGMFRCADPGFMKTILQNSGFKNIKEQEVNGKVVYEDFDHYWQMTNEVTSSIAGAMSKADEAMKQKIKSEVQQLSQQYKTGNGLEFDFAALVISGNK